MSLVYALLFEDDDDPNDTFPLVHAVLTDHTVPSIVYFFGTLAHRISQA
jgi:hypothetical protein